MMPVFETGSTENWVELKWIGRDDSYMNHIVLSKTGVLENTELKMQGLDLTG